MKTHTSPFVRTAIGAALCSGTLAVLAGCASTGSGSTTEINLVALNDLHGNLEATRFTYTGTGDKEPRTVLAGGIDNVAGALQAWRRDDPALLLVGAGDMIGASPALSAMWADEPTIHALDMLGLSFTSVGNHEFDQGRVELLRQQKGGCASPRADKACQYEANYRGAKFDYLAANVIDANTRKPILPPYRIADIKGIKVAFIGTVLKETADVVASAGIAGLQFIDEADAVNRQLPELRKQGVNTFVVLIHQGGRTEAAYDQQYCGDLQGEIVDVVKRFDPAIRLVISGHSHKGYLCKVDGKLVTQAQMGGHMMSRIKLMVDKQTGNVVDVSARNVIIEPGDYPAEPQVAAFLAQVRERSNRELGKPVAHIATPSVTRERNGTDESALGNLVADATLLSGRPYGAQIAFMNTGGIRQDLESGEGRLVTKGQTQAVLPFGNRLVVMNLTGAQIRGLLEQQWVGDKVNSRGTLQVSEGFTYKYDVRKPEGARAFDILLNGVPLDDTSSYRVAANNFIAEGGDAFPMFKEGTNRVDTAVRDIDSLNEYLVQREQQFKPAGAALAEPRIQRVQ